MYVSIRHYDCSAPVFFYNGFFISFINKLLLKLYGSYFYTSHVLCYFLELSSSRNSSVDVDVTDGRPEKVRAAVKEYQMLFRAR